MCGTYEDMRLRVGPMKIKEQHCMPHGGCEHLLKDVHAPTALCPRMTRGSHSTDTGMHTWPCRDISA